VIVYTGYVVTEY